MEYEQRIYERQSADEREILSDIDRLIAKVSVRAQQGRDRSIVLTKLEEAKLWAHGIPGVGGISGVDMMPTGGE